MKSLFTDQVQFGRSVIIFCCRCVFNNIFRVFSEPAEKTSTVVIEMKGMDFSLIPKEFAVSYFNKFRLKTHKAFEMLSDH